MIFALDFDRTLFDTDADIAALAAANVSHMIGDPAVHKIVDPVPYLYPDTMSFLAAQDRGCTYVVSAVTVRYGPLSEAYQGDKIRRTGVAAVVREVMLTGDSKVAALSTITTRYPGEHIIFVDDRTDVLAEVHAALPDIVCVHIMRSGAKRMSDIELPRDIVTITSLAELSSLIQHYA